MDAPAPSSVSLPRERRIRQGRDFARAKTEGRRIVQGCLILNWVNLPPGSISRVGVITSRRVGEAVVRSRARRHLREVFRLNQPQLVQAADVVLVARPSIAGKRFEGIMADYLTALKKARLYRGDSAESLARS